MTTPAQILRQYWGHTQFRPLQEDIINAILAGQDTLALLPTGGGKSVCFQVPAMMKEGLCLVVTPLIALMRDQVANLERRGIKAVAIYAGLTNREVEQRLEQARRGHYKFLYVSPERLQSRRFLDYCDGLPVNLLAVDEAHCISQWGYDFRPAYLQIATIRAYFPNVPVLALTASATPLVQEDICRQLLMQHPQVFTKSFTRDNLSYSVLEEESRQDKLKHILDRVPGSAIVYCRNRKRTRQLADLLRMQGISAAHYHAGLPPEERTLRQEEWIHDKVRVIVCTNAFGMGIDKPNVRLVIHYDVPDSPEAYYQEAGRAGRDEQKAYAVLLYNEPELQEMREKIAQQFPSLAEIKHVHQCIVNYLQVATGSSEGMYYDFDINEFVKHFQLNITVAYSAIRIMEQEGVLQLSESVCLPSRVGFITNKETLYAIEELQPSLDPLIKALLRTYEGIFDNEVRIFEKQLARIIRKPEDQVIAQLQQLHQRGIIQYRPKKDEPQLSFLQERLQTHLLRVNMERIAERRRVYTERLDAMFRYVRNKKTCRTQTLVTYFGEQESTPCGICDVCLKNKRKPVKAAEFDEIAAMVMLQLQQPKHLDTLLENLPDVEEERLLEVLQFLVSEEKLIRDHDDILRIN
ncbi:RecQ family ATP-dependent DNA helicase [Chitinophaga agrisoli]|uniref:ATP-dependent DNA helicase RecQ n=1 Tax=Chitinophaga agrisoli TaxID=2607653 RepID=A0A5B2W4L6_9BACT|nr:ATP-dependent DNA helicase RecQ [Chitinophaga agrisoli]KAA2245650.1 RecQ family ATP-dependent DNA helicase [Chitinophaga agrisoli]